MTIVLAERDAEEVAELCDRVLLLKDGSLLADGGPRDVLSRVELLETAGVAPPQMVQLSSLLSRAHPGSISEFLTVDEAELEISRLASIIQGRQR